MPKKKGHYIDNKRFEEVIFGYKKNKKKYEQELIKLLDILITNILMSFKFRVDHDDAKQECFMLAFKTLKNFSPKNGSAFNYFTTVIVNNLKLLYTKDKKYTKKLQDYKELVTGESGVFKEYEEDPSTSSD